MGNCIENFFYNKIFGGINGTSKSNQHKKTKNSSKPISFESNVSSGKNYIKSLEEKEARVYSKWNQFKQRFGFGERLTAEEISILHKVRMQECFRKRREEFEKRKASWQ